MRYARKKCERIIELKESPARTYRLLAFRSDIAAGRCLARTRGPGLCGRRRRRRCLGRLLRVLLALLLQLPHEHVHAAIELELVARLEKVVKAEGVRAADGGAQQRPLAIAEL